MFGAMPKQTEANFDGRTSGLDSSIALSVMQVLRDIAASGRTVIGG
jgi:hypothetical protein